MTDRMIMASDGEIMFMYRVGGIAIHNGRLLVGRNLRDRYCFVPGGRVEYGETAVEALARELHEELGEALEIGRLVIMSDNVFELNGKRYQEVAPYLLVELAAESGLLDMDGTFEGNEPEITLQWIPIDDVEKANLFPPFLRERVRKVPRTPEYIVHSDLESSLA